MHDEDTSVRRGSRAELERLRIGCHGAALLSSAEIIGDPHARLRVTSPERSLAVAMAAAASG